MSVLTVDDYRQLFFNQQQQQQQKGYGVNRYSLAPFYFPQQQGEGIGSFFVNLLRNQILPLVPSLLKNTAGLALNVANSLSNNSNNGNVGNILKTHGQSALKNIAVDALGHVQKQIGSGKKRKVKRTSKSSKRSGSKRKKCLY